MNDDTPLVVSIVVACFGWVALIGMLLVLGTQQVKILDNQAEIIARLTELDRDVG